MPDGAVPPARGRRAWDAGLPFVQACSRDELRLLDAARERYPVRTDQQHGPPVRRGLLDRRRDRAAGYEAQAAAELEAAARSARDGDGSYAFALTTDGGLPWPLDAAPVIAAAAADALAGVPGAARSRCRFHRAVVSAVADVAERARAVAGIGEVTLSGGVFVNVLLSAWCAQELAARGFTVLRHHRVPPTDAGLALGQVAVAAKQVEGERCA